MHCYEVFLLCTQNLSFIGKNDTCVDQAEGARVWLEPPLFDTQNMVAAEDSDRILANTNSIIKMVTIKIANKPLR